MSTGDGGHLTVTEPRVGRRASVSTRDSSDMSGDHKMHLSQPHRRMSRVVDIGAYRRMSMFRRPSMAASMRTNESNSRKPPQLENTYKLGPDDDDKFNCARVKKAIGDILESYLEGEAYDAKKCQKMVQSLTDVIKARVKEMHFPRYKIVCHVILGQNADQCMQFSSRFVWNTATDNFASASYKSGSIFAVATVFGIYLD